MILVEFLQKSGHDGRTVKGSLGVDIEPPAVFRDYRHFTVIQIDDLTMSPAEGVLLLFQIFRIDGYFVLFPSHSSLKRKISGKVRKNIQFPCYLLRNIVTFAA